jgi:hypothetical protein
VLIVAIALVTGLTVTLIHRVTQIRGLNSQLYEADTQSPSGGKVRVEILPIQGTNNSSILNDKPSLDTGGLG